MAIAVGDRAPDFELRSGEGETVRLSALRGRPVVLFFYPKDGTPGCTAEACAFRNSMARFQDLGATVLGISGDDVASHQRFARQHDLGFALLADAGNQIRRQFGVPSALFVLPGRVTYVIDADGIVQLVFNAMFDSDAHSREAIACLERLQA